MSQTDIVPLESTTEIAATPERVWDLVSDLGQMKRWSPQVVFTHVRGGQVREGAKMVNLNRKGLLVWPTQTMVTDYQPGRRIAFRVKENWVVWSFTLEPTATGTRVVHRRETPKGISGVSTKLQDAVLGGVDDFTVHLQEGMHRTLARLKAEAETTAAA